MSPDPVPFLHMSHPPLRRRRYGLWLLAGVAVVVGALAVVAVTAWNQRTVVATTAVKRLLDSAGLGGARFTIDRVDLSGAQLSTIGTADGGVTIDEMTLTFSPAGLARRQVGSVTLLRPRIVASSSGGSGDGGVPAFPDWQIARIVVTDGRVVLPSEDGPLDVTLSGSATLANGAFSDGRIAAVLSGQIAGAAQRVTLDSPVLSLRPQAGGLRLQFQNARLRARDVAWDAAGVGGDVTWQPGKANAKLSVASLTSTDKLIVPVQLAASASLAANRVDFTLGAVAAQGSGKLQVDAEGWHDLGRGTGEAKLGVPVLTFGPGFQPGDLFPSVAGVFGPMTGMIALAGPLRWDDDGITSDLVLRLAGMGVETSGAALADVGADIRIVSLLPPATAPAQRLSGTVQFGSLPASPADLRFQLRPDGRLAVEGLTLGFGGGELSAAPFTLDPQRPDMATTITARALDVAALFKLADVDGLSGTGRLEGTIPLRAGPGGVSIGGGHLVGSEPGILSLKRSALPPALVEAGSNETVSLVLNALEDFRYQVLSLDIEQSDTAPDVIRMGLEGANPSLLDGHPIRFNIRFESDFDRLTDIALRTMTATRSVLRLAARSARP